MISTGRVVDIQACKLRQTSAARVLQQFFLSKILRYIHHSMQYQPNIYQSMVSWRSWNVCYDTDAAV